MRTNPIVQRRTRLLDEAAHYSHVSPLPFPFPYRIEVDENSEESDRNKAVERWLSEKEALTEVDVGPSVLKAYSSEQRIKDFQLIGIAPKGLQDCLPALDVGDAFEHIGQASLAPGSGEISKERHPTMHGDSNVGNEMNPNDSSYQTRTRKVLTDILSGHTVLFDPSEDKGYAPWSLRYSGHQFGNWAGQLGDGRAISICQSKRSTACVLQLMHHLTLFSGGSTSR